MHNRGFFQIRSNHARRQSKAACQTSACITLLEWLSVVLLIGTVVLFPESPAWGADGAWGIGGHIFSASISEFGGISLLFGCCLLTTLYGFRLVIRSLTSEKEIN